MTILHLDASGRHEGSASRLLSRELVEQIRSPSERIIYRDIGAGLPLVDDLFISGIFTSEEDRTEEQRAALALSDELVAELFDADTYVFGLPIYNFSMPAAFKAWADLVARARVTFRYSESGPVGLLTGKRAYLVVVSGGTDIDSDFDFLTGWVKHFLGFLGIKDITIVSATSLMSEGEAKIARARAAISQLRRAA